MDVQSSHQSWNILVCGDVGKIFGLLVKNPKACSVLDLKKLIEIKSGITVESQTLFFEEKLLENEKILTDYSNMSTGSALYLARKPLTIETLDCFGVKVTLKIPTKKPWPISQLREFISFKRRLPLGTFVLMCEGDVLEDGPAEKPNFLDDYPQIVDGCLITVTPVRLVHLELPNYSCSSITTEALIFPQKSSHQFIEKRIEECNGILNNQIQWSKSIPQCPYYDPDLVKHSEMRLSSSTISDNGSANSGIRRWPKNMDRCEHVEVHCQLNVQMLDGTKVSVTIPASEPMHVMHLRELIEKKTGVPTHKQRLALGTTVLEDWDEEGKIMQLHNYPTIYDGATLYLIQLTTGKRFQTTHYQPLSSSEKDIPYKFCDDEYERRAYNYVNIPDPEKYLQSYLVQILQRFGAQSRARCCWDSYLLRQSYFGCNNTGDPVSEMTCGSCRKKWMQS